MKVESGSFGQRSQGILPQMLTIEAARALAIDDGIGSLVPRSETGPEEAIDKYENETD